MIDNFIQYDTNVLETFTRGSAMLGLEEFYRRLKNVPMTNKGLMDFDTYLDSYRMPEGILEDNDRLCNALADRLIEIKTLPTAKLFVEIVFGMGCRAATELSEKLLEIED